MDKCKSFKNLINKPGIVKKIFYLCDNSQKVYINNKIEQVILLLKKIAHLILNEYSAF